MIDSESEKVQLWIENSLIVNQYVKEDAEKLSMNQVAREEMVSC